jgi:hypothetical protein
MWRRSFVIKSSVNNPKQNRNRDTGDDPAEQDQGFALHVCPHLEQAPVAEIDVERAIGR